MVSHAEGLTEHRLYPSSYCPADRVPVVAFKQNVLYCPLTLGTMKAVVGYSQV